MMLPGMTRAPWMKTILLPALFSAGLYVAAIALGLGFLFLFLSSLPLLLSGLRYGAGSCLLAGGIAGLLLSGIGAAEASVIYLLCVALPCGLMSTTLPRTRAVGEAREWFPMGLSLTHVTVYGCCVIAACGLAYIGAPGGLEGVVSGMVQQALDAYPEEYQPMVQRLSGPLSFLIFSVTGWLWVLALYFHAWLAIRWLRPRAPELRPSAGMTPFVMPRWVFSLLLLCAFASVAGGPTTAYLGKTALMLLMLPYFLLGVALMHAASQTWPNRQFFLFIIYFLLVAQLWPVLGLSLWGLAHQIKYLSNRPSSSKH